MFDILEREKGISAAILLFFGLSIVLRLLLGVLYSGMIREADNMAATRNRLLRQCKLKFTNCYQLNNGVANIPVFVDKFINRLSLGAFSFEGIYHFSGQSMLLCVASCGLGICKGIIRGRMLGEILPFYMLCFMGLYLYFSVSAAIDIQSKKRILKVNLIDYLENHLSARIGVTKKDINMLYGGETIQRQNRESTEVPEKSLSDTRDQTEELEALLKEFLAM